MTFPLVYLRDTNTELVECWKRYFSKTPNVSISEGDIFDIPADALVSPANGFGLMNGGIDLDYTKKFGTQLQDRVTELIRPFGEIPVGSAVSIVTEPGGPFLVIAPTMRLPPFNLDNTLSPYYSFRAALLQIKALAETASITSVICPGMGTGAGRACVDMTARQMFAAYHNVVSGLPVDFGDLMGQQQWMLACSASEEKAKKELEDAKKAKEETDAPNTNS